MTLKAHRFSVKRKLRAKLRKLAKKDNMLYIAIKSKMREIIHCPDVNHYKNLRGSMKHLKRVHITKRFELLFGYDISQDKIVFVDFDHWDNIFR